MAGARWSSSQTMCAVLPSTARTVEAGRWRDWEEERGRLEGRGMTVNINHSGRSTHVHDEKQEPKPLTLGRRRPTSPITVRAVLASLRPFLARLLPATRRRRRRLRSWACCPRLVLRLAVHFLTLPSPYSTRSCKKNTATGLMWIPRSPTAKSPL